LETTALTPRCFSMVCMPERAKRLQTTYTSFSGLFSVKPFWLMRVIFSAIVVLLTRPDAGHGSCARHDPGGNKPGRHQGNCIGGHPFRMSKRGRGVRIFTVR
jgi:hypothetical protein